MTRLAMAALSAALVFGAALPAEEDVAAKKPLGTWSRRAGDTKVHFDIQAHTLHVTITDDEKTIDIDADYGTGKGDVLFGRVNKVEFKGAGGGLSAGVLFSFHYTLKGDTLTISDLYGPSSEEGRQLIEGEYKGTPARPKSR